MNRFRILVPVASPLRDVKGRYSTEMEGFNSLDVEFVECGKEEEAFISAARGVHAVYVRGVRISRCMVEALDHCRIIALASVGVEYVDIEAATEKGIPVTNCPDTFIDEVADHTMMLLLAAHRRALIQDRIVREGHWEHGRAQLLKVPRLLGQTLGVIGFGRVGRAVASRARPFGMRVLAHDPFVDETTVTIAGVEPVDLGELLRTSDFISLHVPETEKTIGLLDAEHFGQMKPGAILINTGRGSTVVESALVQALESGRIAGAGLDVFAQEPVDVGNPLLSLQNVILSPHNASASARFEPARKRRVGSEIALVFAGRWPMNCVNPQVLSGSGLIRWR